MAVKLLDLDGLCILLRDLKPYLGKGIDVLPFADSVSASSITNATLSAEKAIVYYNTATNSFIFVANDGFASTTPTYYANWTGAASYKNADGNNAPADGKIYIDNQGRVYTNHEGKLREVGSPWVFSSSMASTSAPSGFTSEAKGGDRVMFGTTGTGIRYGMVLFRNASTIYIGAVSSAGFYIYSVSASTGRLTLNSSTLMSNYAKAADVNALDTRVATLESQKRWIDVTMWIENSDVNHIENDIQSWNIAAMLNMSLAEIASYEGVRITDGYGQRYYLRWWFISDDTTEIRCSDFYYKGARFAAWIDDERLINLKYKETI